MNPVALDRVPRKGVLGSVPAFRRLCWRLMKRTA